MLRRITRAAIRRARLIHDTARAALGAFEVGDSTLRVSLGAESFEAMMRMIRTKELRFFFTRQEKRALAARFLADHPETARAVIAQADAACRHEFELLGAKCPRPGSFNKLTPGIHSRMPWHEDFATGRRWKKRYSAVLPVQYSDGSDIKRVWELSRCQHFGALGIAHLIAECGLRTAESSRGEAPAADRQSAIGNLTYASEWVAQMTDWDRQNPPLIGPNWMSPMEVAIQIVNWIWGFAFMGDSPAFTDEARKVFYRNLLSHGRFILRHLEGYGNHRFSNFVGLVFLGVLFPEFKEATDWREAGIKGFCEELERQVRSDGVHFEGSIPYHRLVLEMAATTWLLLRRNGIELPPASQDAITRMFHFTAAYLPMPLRDASGPRFARFAPQVGDADDGRLQELTPLDKRDHSYLLSLAAVLTGEGEFKLTRDPHPEAFWLLGSEGLKVYDAMPVAQAKEESRAFPESGFYVLSSERLHALISCRRPDARDVGAHSHNDHLSFTLTLDGVEFIVDGGTYTYTGNLKDRHMFRSTSAHNTVIVDGQEINPLKRSDPFRLKDNAHCHVLEWRSGPDEDVLVAEHEGYARLDVKVRREFRHDRRSPSLRIIDCISGLGERELTWGFLFAPQVSVQLSGRELRAERDGHSLRIVTPETLGMRVQLSPGWHSPHYGVKQQTTRLTVACSMTNALRASLSFHWTSGSPQGQAQYDIAPGLRREGLG